MYARKALVLALLALIVSAFLLPLTASATNWSEPFPLGKGALKPSVAIDSEGNQHYVWWNPGDARVQYSMCTGTGGNGCSSPIDLPSQGNSYYPSIAIDPDDRPNVVFETKVGGDEGYATFWTRREGGWTSAVKISNEPYAELPDIAIGPKGHIHVTYQSKQGTTAYVYYTESTDGFSFSAAEELDASQSSAPLSTFAELARKGQDLALTPEGDNLSNGLYPRVAADKNDRAHVAWNAPAPNYGIRYRFQESGGWSGTVSVNDGQKDQTPDITISPTGSVGIIWGTYDDFNAAFAEFKGTNRENFVSDIDGGLAQSLWPKLSVDCVGKFHFVFQGKSSPSSNWNIYYRNYNPANNSLGDRETIASIGNQEQTPVIATTDIAAIIYANTDLNIADAATADLGISCNPPTATPTKTVKPSKTPTATTSPTPTETNTLEPGVTPSATPTATNTPPFEHVRDGDARIQYVVKKTPVSWKQKNDSKASDGEYRICNTANGGTGCKPASNVQLNIELQPGSRIEWETAYANNFGKARIFMDEDILAILNMCRRNKTSSTPKFGTLSWDVPNDGKTHHFSIGVPPKVPPCSVNDDRLIVVDGFNIYNP